jgi:hypothetical protein
MCLTSQNFTFFFFFFFKPWLSGRWKCVNVVCPRRVLEACVAKAIFVLYWNTTEEKKKEKKKEKKTEIDKNKRRRRRSSIQKIFLLPPLFFTHLFCSFFYRNLCYSFFRYSFVFSLHTLLPLKCVLLEQPANRVWYQSLVQRRVSGRKSKRKQMKRWRRNMANTSNVNWSSV